VTGTLLIAIRRSPGRMPAWAAGGLGARFHAWGPFPVFSKATPSSGMSKVSRWTKFSQAKIIAASVASASTTAPRLTRRFCFMAPAEYTPTCRDNEVQTDVHIERLVSTRNRNVFLRLGDWREGQAASIHFMEGH